MKYFMGPEFHRHLWLRFSPFRLLAAPLVLALCVITTTNLPKNVGAITDIDLSSMLYVSLTVFYIVVIVWGTYEAATALQEEIRGNTWDFQRMSSISPAQLALGKLFGATSYTWYFGFMALVVFGYAYMNYHETEQFYEGARTSLRESPFPEPEDDTLYVLFCLVASGLIGQALAFLYSFADSMSLFGSHGRARPPRGIAAFLLGVIAATQVFTQSVMRGAVHLHQRAELLFRHVDIKWYGHDIPFNTFIVASLLFFIGAFLIGSYRIARAELMYRCLPTVWVAFVAAFVAWNCGLILRSMPGGAESFDLFRVLLAACMQTLIICYLTMLTEAADSRQYARLAFHLKSGNYLRALENTPKWLATVPLVLVLFLGVMGQASGRDSALDFAHVTAFMISVMLFMVRDGCVLHAIHLTVRERGGRFAILFYYLLVYGLSPLVCFTSLSISVHDVFKAVGDMTVPAKISRLAGVFFPSAMLDPVTSILPVLIEAAAAAAWLWWRIGKSYSAGVIENPKA